MDETNEVICSCGAVNAATSKFCTECGALLKKAETQVWNSNPGGVSISAVEEKPKTLDLAPADQHLKMLADVYMAVCGLPTGRGRHSEITLYKDEAKGTYELHTYSGDGTGTEHHCGYEVDESFAENICQTIQENAFHKLDETEETPICGGTKVLKFVDRDGNYYRLSAGEGPIRKAFERLYTMLQEGVCSERRIIPEYARKWKLLSAESKGMSSLDNYNFELERSAEGALRIAVLSPTMGGMAAMQQLSMMTPQKNWVELSEEESDAINRIPLGLQFSYKEPKPMMGMGFPMAMTDAGHKKCTITYEDGYCDRKIVDDKMFSDLLEIVRKYLYCNQ